MIQKAIGSVTRHILTGLGGFLAGAGILAKPEDVNDTGLIIAGVLAYLAGQAVSIWKARKDSK